jgi:Holliday junction resolvase RusA-like endonuclease
MKIEFTIPGEVVPTQSVRARIVMKKSLKELFGYRVEDVKNAISKHLFIQFYQPAAIKKYKEKVSRYAWAALPTGFKPFEGPLRVVIVATFPPPKSMSKKYLEIIDFGGTVYKNTKPDLTDNIAKGVIDALEGIIFKNDSQISITGFKKVYGRIPSVYISIEELPWYVNKTLL